MPTESLHTFTAWSLTHWLVIGATASLCVGLAWWRRRNDEARGARLDQGLAIAVMVLWIIVQVAQWVDDDVPVWTVLPLHVSDLTCLAVPLALWMRSQWARALVYYWGLTLGSLAYLIPDLRDGPLRAGFWFFWGMHAAITVGVFYDLFGRRYRPGWRDYGWAVVLSIAYAAVMVPFNAATGYSYGYLGPDRPEQPAVLPYFGAWPWRTVPIVLTGLAGMALLTLPWLRRQRRQPV